MGFEFLVLLALFVWVIVQQNRIGKLSRELAALTRELRALAQTRAAPAETPMPQPANETLPELLLTQVVEEPPAAPEPVTLHIVAPPPAPVVEEKIAPAREPPQQELLLTQVVEPAPAQAARIAPSAPKRSGKTLEQWLAENGLAWIAGISFALGGLLLVGWAQSQGFFTPIRQLFAALILGFGLIGGSEYVRRSAKRTGGHPLAAALLAGAGAATLYATSWAAYGIYGYITLPVAAFALTACAAIFLALSFLHGESLGVLAIGAAFLAPPLSSTGDWPALGLLLYLFAVGAAGFAIAGLQRWTWAAMATTLGAYVWFALSLADNALPRALSMLTLTALGGWGLGQRAPLDKQKHDAWANVQDWLPSIALGLSALLDVLCWNSAALNAPASIVGPALIGIFLVGLSAFAVRGAIARPAALLAAMVALAIGVMAYGRNLVSPLGLPPLLLWSLLSAGAVTSSALAAAPQSRERALISGIGSFSALFILFIAAATRPVWTAPDVWAVLAVGGLLMAGAALYMTRSAKNATKDWAVDFWCAAGAAAILLALESFSISDFKPAAIAGAALLFAGVFSLRGWRSAGAMAGVAGGLALTHALSPAFSGAVWSGGINIWRAESVLVLDVIGLCGAAWLTNKRTARAQITDALTTLAILTGLLAAFLFLHFISAGAAQLDALTENALRGLMLIAAGFAALPRRDRKPGPIARWRGHVLMLAGFALTIVCAEIRYNPWWGSEPAHVDGLALINVQAVAFAAPALLAFLASNRLYLRTLTFARLYSGLGAVFGVSWIVLEIRHAFHGADMATGAIGLVEGDLLGLAALAATFALVFVARRRAGIAGNRPFTHDLIRMTGATVFAGIIAGVAFLLAARNAWWGSQDAAQTDAVATALGTLALAPAAALATVIGASLPTLASKARFVGASAAALFALAFGFLALRWAHHQGAMDDQPPLIGLEGLLYALWPMAFVGAGAKFSEWLVRRAQTRELALDFDAIWSVAVWPVLIFSGVALWALFNPWRGVWPAQAGTLFLAIIGLACYIAAAWLSIWLSRLGVVELDPLFPRTAKIAAIVHLFAAAMLIVRRAFHGADMTAQADVSSFEMWAYSATWAAYAAIVWRYGAWRRDAVVRWSGLLLLIAVSVKVLLIDTSQINPAVRALIILPVGAILLMVTLSARKLARRAGSSLPSE